MKEENSRILWLDIVRFIAIILVLLCHSIEAIYKMSLPEFQNLSLGSQLFMNILFPIGRLGVPFFLFLTGYLLLYKKIDKTEDYKIFYKKKLIPLLIVTEIWIIIYNIFLSFYTNSPLSIIKIVLNMLFLDNVNLPNMWYMPTIIGIYLFLPIIASILKKIDLDYIFKLMLFAFILLFIPQILEYNTTLDLSFSGGIYGLYIITGFFIGKGKLKNISILNLIIIILFYLSLAVCYQISLSYIDVSNKIWYSHISLFISAACIFELISRIKFNVHNFISKFISYISKISFGIYFIHIIVQNILVKIIDFTINPSSVLILLVLVFIISIIIISLLSIIKPFKKYLFYIK